MQQWTPVAATERSGLLDAVRALALFGIFAVNLEWFNRPWQEFGEGAREGLAGADALAAWAIQVFVAGKAWLLFSLLFGIGFALMQARAARAGRDFAPVHRRRAWTLLAIGLAHGALLWPGDILRTYALAAFLMPALGARSPRAQRDLGLGLYLGLVALGMALALLATAWGADAATAENGAAAAAAAAQVYAHGGYLEVTLQRVRDLLPLIAADIGGVPLVLGAFLLGDWLLRSGRIGDPAAHARYHRGMAWVGLPAGLALAVATTLAFGLNAGQAGGAGRWYFGAALQQLAALPVALGVLSAATLCWSRPRGRRALAAIAPAGRMALSHYLLQSLLASTLFYGYGLALWGRPGPAALLALAVAAFGLQVLASRWWLARFRFGPVEWAWRWATYGERPPMRQATGTAA